MVVAFGAALTAFLFPFAHAGSPGHDAQTCPLDPLVLSGGGFVLPVAVLLAGLLTLRLVLPGPRVHNLRPGLLKVCARAPPSG